MSTTMPEPIDIKEEEVQLTVTTRCATLRGYADLLVVQLNEDTVLTSTGIEEIITAIGSMPGDGQFLVLLKIPEGTDIELEAMQTRYAVEASLRSRIRAFAIVTHSRMFVQLTQLYLAYHSCTVPSAIFREWDEACYWATGKQLSRDAA
jgi:hypothetical protein